MFKLPYYWFGILLSIATGCLFGLTFVANCWLGWNDLLVSAVLQVAGVFLALTLAYFFFELRSHQREEGVKKTIRLFTDRLKLMAEEAVVRSAEQMLMDPLEQARIDHSPGNKRYDRARELVLVRPMRLKDYEGKPMTYDSLRGVVDCFERLAGSCELALNRIGPSLVEFGFLMRVMINLEGFTKQEVPLLRGFAAKSRGGALLPALAQMNLLVLAQLAIELIDILNNSNFEDSPKKINGKNYPNAVPIYSGQWGGELP